MQIELPPMEIKAKASSSYTREHIDRRLAELEGREDAEAAREREYLRALLVRRQAGG